MYIFSLKKLWKIQHAYSAPTSYHFTTLWPPQYVYYAKYIRTNENNVKAANYIYIRNISIQEKEWNVKPPPENKNKFRRTARRTII
jgi:hypothetical protein